MKSKKIFTSLLAMVLTFASVATHVSAFSTLKSSKDDILPIEEFILTEESLLPEESLLEEELIINESYLVEDDDKVSNKQTYGTTSRKTYSVNWTVKANKTATGATNMYMYVGSTVSFNLSYTPSANASIRIGLTTPINSFRYYAPNNGSLSATMTLNRPGIHKLKIVNNSSFDITVTGTYTTSITTPDATTWFSQKSSSVGTTWSSTYLSSLYCPNMATCYDYCGLSNKCANTPWYTTSSYTPASNQLPEGHINKFGCNISSIAMIFRNLSATTTTQKFDFRSGLTDYLSSDPFTLTMANIGWPAITQNGSRYEITSYTSTASPENVNWDNTASSFGLSPYKVEFNNETPSEKANLIAYYIANNPEGILVRVANSHSVVFTDTIITASLSSISKMPQEILVTSENVDEIMRQELEDENAAVRLTSPTSTTYDSMFTCYDPATSDPNESMGVPYSDTWTAGYYGGIDQVTYIYYYD